MKDLLSKIGVSDEMIDMIYEKLYQNRIKEVERIEKGAFAIVLTVNVQGMSHEQWCDYASFVLKSFKKDFPDTHFIVVPDQQVRVEALNEIGVLKKLAGMSPEFARLLAKPV